MSSRALPLDRQSESQQPQAGTLVDAARRRCWAVAGFPSLSVQMEVGVHAVNYSAPSQGAAAWRHMSSCLGVTDTEAGKYLLDHLVLVGLVSGPSCFL